jgi:hypothetical protein
MVLQSIGAARLTLLMVMSSIRQLGSFGGS